MDEFILFLARFMTGLLIGVGVLAILYLVV